MGDTLKIGEESFNITFRYSTIKSLLADIGIDNITDGTETILIALGGGNIGILEKVTYHGLKDNGLTKDDVAKMLDESEAVIPDIFTPIVAVYVSKAATHQFGTEKGKAFHEASMSLIDDEKKTKIKRAEVRIRAK